MSTDKETFTDERNPRTAPMPALIQHIRRNAVGYLALFVALGGTGYAAANLPRASVGARQIKNHAITPSKFDPEFINGSVRAWAVVRPDGTIVRGGGKPKGGKTATSGVYALTWGVRLNHGCATIATVDGGSVRGARGHFIAGPVTASSMTKGAGRFRNITFVDTLDQSGKLIPLGFSVAVIC
jgi:hypothetical protein